MNIFKYVGLGMGIIESVIAEEEEAKSNAQIRPPDGLSDGVEGDAGTIKPPDRIVKYDLETGKEIRDETK
nr:hypothetical protein [uncultured Sphingobacterium sp.]